MPTPFRFRPVEASWWFFWRKLVPLPEKTWRHSNLKLPFTQLNFLLFGNQELEVSPATGFAGLKSFWRGIAFQFWQFWHLWQFWQSLQGQFLFYFFWNLRYPVIRKV